MNSKVKSNEVKDPFRLQKKNYHIDFLPVYQRLGFTPKQLFQTSIKLPFHIPFKNGTCVTFQVDDDRAVTFIFNSIRTQESYKSGLLTNQDYKITTENNIVECIYIVEDKFPIPDDGIQNLPSFLFNMCLEKLNFLILGYLITTKDISAHKVTTRMFEIQSLFRFVNISNWEAKNGILLLHQDIPYIKKTINEKLHEKVVRLGNVINQNLNPFIFCEELILNAKRNVIKGFYKEAIIHCQTSFETFIKTLLVEIYKSDNSSLFELENQFERGFLGLLKKTCHNKIGGNWNITDKSNPIYEWYHKCYSFRNKIVHIGYSPTYNECIEAIESVELCKDYIIKLIYKKKNKYPKIFEYIILDNK